MERLSGDMVLVSVRESEKVGRPVYHANHPEKDFTMDVEGAWVFGWEGAKEMGIDWRNDFFLPIEFARVFRV